VKQHEAAPSPAHRRVGADDDDVATRPRRHGRRGIPFSVAPILRQQLAQPIEMLDPGFLRRISG
jgi:hypothetical protein